MNTFIIAEAGINHNGDLETAKRMVDAAKEAGADCIKFQTFKAEEFVSDKTQTYTYLSNGQEVTESMYEMFKRYEFSEVEWRELVLYCDIQDIVFSSTAQNSSDLDFLLSLTNLPFIKVGSDDLTSLEQLSYYASKGLPMIISAGMAYAYEIEDAVRTIQEAGNDNITILHCVSSYPTEAEEVNLNKIPIIREAFEVRTGFSDHTQGSAAAVGAVCMGAKVIEKHFTLDHSMAGPDHWFSVNPLELKQYIQDIRFIEKAMGSSELRPTQKEMQMRKLARRKAVAAKELQAGETLQKEDVVYKRISEANDKSIEPKNIDMLLGRVLKNGVAKETPLTLGMFI